MENKTLLSVIIPTLNRDMKLHDLMGSLERQIIESETTCFEVIVVSNLPNPALKKTVESYGPRFRYFETGRIGANLARNRGLERAKGDIAVFLDDDCYVSDRNFLARIKGLHEQWPNVIGIGGRYALPVISSEIEQAYHWIADHWLTRSRINENESLNLIGGNCSFKVRSSLIQRPAHIHFNEDIVFGGAETDLFARLQREGHQMILVDDLFVEHRLQVNPWTLRKKAYLQGFAAGRRQTQGLEQKRRYWHSTVTISQNMSRYACEPTKGLSRQFSVYEAYFNFGRARALGSQLTKAMPLRIFDFWLYRLNDFRKASLKSLSYRAFLVADRALALFGRPR